MKQKLHALIWFGAALLALAGCQQENVEVLGQGDSEVKAQFVFNVSTNTTATKQLADNTQANGTSGKFLGINDAKLLTYSLSSDGQILKTDQTADKIYDLASVMNAATASSFKSRRVLEMSLPLNTNTVLFYGKAPDITTGSYGEYMNAKDVYGALDPENGFIVGKDAGSANFQLCKRLEDKDGFYAMEKVMAGILTVIMNDSLSVKAGTHGAISATAKPDQNNNPYGFSFPASPSAAGGYPEITWADYAGTNSPVEPAHTLYPLEEKLGRAYKQMTTIYTNDGELRAGSGEATLRIITDLWTVVNSVRCAAPTSPAEAVAKFFAEEIDTHLSTYFTATPNGTGAPITNVGFKTMKLICDGLVADKFWPQNAKAIAAKPTGSWDETNSTYTGELGLAYDYNPKDFPFCFNILRGAAYTTFDKTNLFYKYPKYFNTSEVGGDPYDPATESGHTAEDYYYPAQLLYFGNSPVRTSAIEHTESEYPDNCDDWIKDNQWAAKTGGEDDWTGTRVKSTTRSVAMKGLIHYGVAMLETRVGYTAAALSNGYIYDNNAAVQERDNPGCGEKDNKVDITTDGSFILTGVIIGGQHEKVDWDFLPKNHENEGFVYDRHVSSSVTFSNGSENPGAGKTAFEPNYTVVFDNYHPTIQETVYVALEFQNKTGHDFFGNYNLIRNNGYFYLIGELNPAGKTLSSWPIEVPPYDYSGEGDTYVGVPRIFIQGYKTTVTFKLSTKSLQAAYLTVPDLRASSLTLGLSVDIDWQQGLDYPEVVIGTGDPTPPSGN